ncbi:MAG: hypothetical protein VXW11_03540, partial [Pseudomonadota bacterium]|nr:hypothetical protein [Pseudomonadota bacterium]
VSDDLQPVLFRKPVCFLRARDPHHNLSTAQIIRAQKAVWQKKVSKPFIGRIFLSFFFLPRLNFFYDVC